MATGTTAPAAPVPYKWTDEDTEVFVRWRVAHKAMFSGGRTANPQGFKKFLEERGLVGRVTTGYLKKKWENLKQKYKLQRRSLEVLPPALDPPPLRLHHSLGPGRLPGSKATATSWKWFDLMHEAIGARPSVAPPVVIATCAPGTVVFTSPSTTTSERVNHGEAGEAGQAAEVTASGCRAPTSSQASAAKKRRVDVAEALQELRGQDEQEWRRLQDEEKKREERREAERARQAAEREEAEERRYREMSEREERYHQEAAEREERWREETRARDERYHREAEARDERWREETRAREERRDQEAAARDERFLAILEVLAKR